MNSMASLEALRLIMLCQVISFKPYMSFLDIMDSRCFVFIWFLFVWLCVSLHFHVFLMLFLWLFFSCYLCPMLICLFYFFLFYFIIFYPLDFCLVSKEIQEVYGFWQEGMWGGTGRSWDRRSCNQNISYEKKPIFYKRKKTLQLVEEQHLAISLEI